MATVRSVSSAAVFKTLTDLAKSSGSQNGTKVTAPELKAALDSFQWGDGKVSKAELIAAKLVVSNLPAGTLSATAKAEFDAWSAANKDATGGLSYDRAAVAFSNLESFVRWNDASQSGAKLTPAEATALLAVMGDNPAPARIAQVLRVRNEAVSAKQVSSTALKVLDGWLKAHPMTQPAGQLGVDLAAATKDLTWPSESDRAIQPFELDVPAGSITATKLRSLFGEPTKTPVETRTLDDAFANLVEIRPDMGDDEKALAQKYANLKAQLAGLKDVKVYRVGNIDIDTYIMGRAPNGKLVGVVTSAIET
ncbi:MAG: nuclease A inhibitor family protein [Myxococcaceae bacterium]